MASTPPVIRSSNPPPACGPGDQDRQAQGDDRKRRAGKEWRMPNPESAATRKPYSLRWSACSAPCISIKPAISWFMKSPPRHGSWRQDAGIPLHRSQDQELCLRGERLPGFGRITPDMENCLSRRVEGSFRHRPSPSEPPGLRSRAFKDRLQVQSNFLPKAPRNKSNWRFVRSMKEKILSPVRNL